MTQTPSWLRGCPLRIPHPSRRLRHLASWRLRCLEFGHPTFQTKVTPLAGLPGLLPAKSGPDEVYEFTFRIHFYSFSKLSKTRSAVVYRSTSVVELAQFLCIKKNLEVENFNQETNHLRSQKVHSWVTAVAEYGMSLTFLLIFWAIK